MSKELENATTLAQRQTIRGVNTAGTVVMDDNTNQASIPGFPYIFLAKGDHILVAVDIFKSGYECKKCLGKTKIQMHCVCEDTTRPGFKYNQEQIDEYDKTLSLSIAVERGKMVCINCGGDFASYRKEVICPECNGKGSLLHMPDQAKTLPTTGVIVSLGSEVPSNLGYKCGQRVLFGAYVGVMIPTKAPGVVFKILRSIEILCEIKGGENLANFDFVTIDKDL